MFVGFIKRLLLKNTPAFGKLKLFLSSGEDKMLYNYASMDCITVLT